MKSVKALVLGGALLLWATAACAVDSVSIEIGSTFKNPETTLARIGAQWDWSKRWFEKDGWFLSGYWDASLGRWHSADEGGSHDVTDFGVTPVFRYQKAGAGPYLEAAIGFHYLTNTDITQQRRFSTHFQFGDHLGAGVRFGKNGEYDLSYRLQHLSNCGIDHPNPGINFHQVRFEYHFQ